jgi:hypothetical protein
MARSTATQAVRAKAGVAAHQFKNFLNSKRAALMADFAAFCREKGADVQ